MERIENENLKVRPGWIFVAREMGLDFGAILAIAASALSLGLAINLIVEKQKELHIFNLPFLWIASLLVALIISYKIIVNLSFMYRFRLFTNMLVLTILSISGGYFVFANGKAEIIENKLEEIPVYSQIVSIPEEAQKEMEIKNYQPADNVGREDSDDEDYGNIDGNKNEGNNDENNDENEENSDNNEDLDKNEESSARNKDEGEDNKRKDEENQSNDDEDNNQSQETPKINSTGRNETSKYNKDERSSLEKSFENYSSKEAVKEWESSRSDNDGEEKRIIEEIKNDYESLQSDNYYPRDED